MAAYDSRVLGGTQATRQQYRAVPAAPIRRQGGAPAPPGAPDYVPPVDDYAQAQALFQRLLGPEIASLNSLYAGRAKSGMDAIGGFTKQLAAVLAPLAGQMRGIYGGAEQSQAASDAALRQALAGGGQSLADTLSAKLGAINAPGAQVADVAGGQAQTGVGAGNAGFALGSAELGRLIGTGTAEQTFAAKQPGIAGFTGLQKAGELQQSLQSELADKIAGMQGQGPAFVQSQVADVRANRTALAKNRQDLALANAKSKQTLAIAKDRSDQAWARIQQGTANAADRRAYQANLLQLRQQGIITKQEYDAQTLALRKRGQDITLRGQDLTNARAGGTGGKGLTAGQQAKLKGTAFTMAEQTYKGFTAADGTSHPPIGYQQALIEMQKEGVPVAIGMQALDRFYKQGERGRPFLNIYERRALLAGGVNPDAVRMGTFNGITAGQLRQTYAGILRRAQSAGAPPLGGSQNTALVKGTYPLAIIKKYSAQYGLDPAAVLAYAMTQGTIGSVGDNGTSFGPFQAHIGGAAGNRSPADAAAWANSEQGLAQMMSMMSRAGARGRKGPDAAAYIVGPSFGRGANPARDMANARAAYKRAHQLIYGGGS